MSERLRLCVLTTAHPVGDVRVYTRMACSLLDAGYTVEWIGPDRQIFGQAECEDSRIKYYKFRKNGSRLKRLLASRVAKKTALTQIQGVDWWYCPDPDAAAVAEHLSCKLGGRVIFDIHEAFDKGVIDRWFGGKAPRLAKRWVRWRIGRICGSADVVTGVNETVLHGYAPRKGKPVVTRLCAPSFFGKEVEDHAEPTTPRMRMIHGKAVAGVGTEQVLDALQHLSPEARSGVEVTLIKMSDVGPGVPEGINQRLQALAAADHEAVELIQRLPHDKMPIVLARHQVGMIAYQRNLGVEALPNRFFEYMAAGLAIVAPSYSKEIVPIIEKEQIGLLVDFEKPKEIAAALEWLAAHPSEVKAMGLRARQAFISTYNWDNEFAKLLQAMRAVELGTSA